MCAHMEQQGKVDPEAGGLGLPAGHRHTGGVSYTSVSLTDHVLFAFLLPYSFAVMFVHRIPLGCSTGRAQRFIG